MHRVISVARAETKQRLGSRLRQGLAGRASVRIDAAEMTPPTNPKGTKAVEILLMDRIKYG